MLLESPEPDGITRIWDVLDRHAGYFVEKLNPPSEWAERLLRSTTESYPGHMIHRMVPEPHPWVAHLPDREQTFKDVVEATLPDYAHVSFEAAREYPDDEQWRLIAPAGDAERTLWNRLVDLDPEGAFEWLAGNLERRGGSDLEVLEGEALRFAAWQSLIREKLTPEEIAPALVWPEPREDDSPYELDRAAGATAWGLSKLVREWPVCLSPGDPRACCRDARSYRPLVAVALGGHILL